jgi:hypothetical protein
MDDVHWGWRFCDESLVFYKPKATFWALKMEVMSADDKATE